MGKINVFLLPYAGASSLVYYKWKSYFPDGFEPRFLELNGRGEKMDEPFYEDMAQAVEDISTRIITETGSDEYCIFGHSMGALLAFEAYYSIRKKGAKPPKHMFFSGRKAPQIVVADYQEYKRDDEHFLQMVSQFGGLPEEFMEESVCKMFLPILRADFKLIGEYVFTEKKHAIDCNISAFYGDQDESAVWSEMEAWRVHAGKDCHFYEFTGNHFFVNEKYPKIVQLIVEAVS